MSSMSVNAKRGRVLPLHTVILGLLCVSMCECRLGSVGFHSSCTLGLRGEYNRLGTTARSFKHVLRRTGRERGHSSHLAMVTYAEALIIAPQATKAATAAVLGALGDFLAQVAEKPGRPLRIDRRRSSAMTLFAVSYTGIFQAWWIKQLGDLVQLQAPVADAAAKTLLCQFGTIPLIYMPLFFAITGALRGESQEETTERAKQDYFRIYLRNIGFWIPVQMIQFFYVAPSWQIPFLSVMGLLWNAILSFIGLKSPSSSAQPAWSGDGAEIESTSSADIESTSFLTLDDSSEHPIPA